jgi:hypothetical protein
MDLDCFMAVIGRIEDVLSMIDCPNISIGTEFASVPIEYLDDDDENPRLAIKVSFDLKYGWVKVLFHKGEYQWLGGSVFYYDRSNSQYQDIKFDDEDSSFRLALKKIVGFDKTNSSNKRDSISDSQGNRELDLLRSELSKIN